MAPDSSYCSSTQSSPPACCDLHLGDLNPRQKACCLVVVHDSRRYDIHQTESGANFYSPSPVLSTNELVIVWDPEVGRVNLSEHKQLKLARSLARGVVDRDLKPSSKERKSIQTILKYPPTRTLNGEDKQLLWKFRFSLMSDKKALTKFLKCVE